MKTKIWVGVLFYSFMGCANKAPKSNLTSKSIPKEPEGYGVRYIPGSPDKPGGLSIQLCKSEKKEFYIRYSS